MIPARILLTGSRAWDSKAMIVSALSDVSARFPQHQIIILVHGACPTGADKIADDVWLSWMDAWPGLFAHPERYPAEWDKYGKAAGFRRNADMVNLGADVCVAFADKWESGTGHCARLARKAGIETIDYGVPTAVKDSPVEQLPLNPEVAA